MEEGKRDGAIAGYVVLIVGSVCGYFYVRKKKANKKYNRLLLMLSAIGAVCLMAGIWEQWGDNTDTKVYQLERNEAGEGDSEFQLYLNAGDLLQQYEYWAQVQEQQLTKVQAEQILEQAKTELETVILGENPSAEEVSKDLTLPETLQNGKVQVDVSFEPYDMMETDGTILWEKVQEETLVKVMAQLSCQDFQMEHEFYLQLIPISLEGTQGLLAEIDRRIAEENKNQGKAYIELPKEINGIFLEWSTSEKGLHARLLVLGLAFMAVWYVAGKEKNEKQQKYREMQLKLDYPDIVSQLSLLTGAGMTMPTAWSRLAQEYRKGQETGKSTSRPGYEELLKTWYEMQDGTSEIKAYENFGKRCNLPQYRKFASLLTQNVRKGTKGLQQLLDAEAVEAFSQRKAQARQLGEEAGTKLLLPMGIMLILVFAILLMPAMLSLNI